MILFCIDCSESMHELRDDPAYENVQTCHLLSALDAAMQIQKKKVVVGPNDSIGILLFNTVRCFYIVFWEDVQRCGIWPRRDPTRSRVMLPRSRKTLSFTSKLRLSVHRRYKSSFA